MNRILKRVAVNRQSDNDIYVIITDVNKLKSNINTSGYTTDNVSNDVNAKTKLKQIITAFKMLEKILQDNLTKGVTQTQLEQCKRKYFDVMVKRYTDIAFDKLDRATETMQDIIQDYQDFFNPIFDNSSHFYNDGVIQVASNVRKILPSLFNKSFVNAYDEAQDIWRNESKDIKQYFKGIMSFNSFLEWLCDGINAERHYNDLLFAQKTNYKKKKK